MLHYIKKSHGACDSLRW